MKKVKISTLKHWEDNPRDITEERFKELLKQLRYGEIENMIVMTDGTVLNGNRRLDAYIIVGREEATVAEVEFKKQKNGKFHMYTDGVLAVHFYPEDLKGKPVEFNSVLQGMTELATVGNVHVGTFNDVKLAELVTTTRVEPQLFHVNLKADIRLEDLVAAFGPDTKEPEPEEEPIDVKSPVRELKFYLKEEDYAFIRATLKKAKKELGLENPNEILLESFIALEDRMDGINYNG